MRKIYSIFISTFIFILASSEIKAQNHYVRAGASGANDGSDWTNAWTVLPATLQRGHVYYIADGSYSSYTFNDTEVGTSQITVRKATVADHGTSIGWLEQYGDGQATFNGRLTFTRGYYNIDGQKRNESDWFDSTAYGLRILHNVARRNQLDQQQIIMGNNGGPATNNITIKYLYISAPYKDVSPDTTVRQLAIDTDTYGGPQNTGLVFSHMYVRGSNNVWFIRTTTGTIIEYCASDGVISNGANHGEIVNVFFSVYNAVIRFNKFRNAYIGSGGTALIAISVGRNETVKPKVECYGNIFYDFQVGDAAIGFLGNTANGGNCSNCRIYNNTFVNGIGGTGIQFPDGTGNEIRNNLWINCGNPPPIVAGAGGIVSHNAFGPGANGSGTNAQVGIDGNAVFTNYNGKDFTLNTATATGFTLASPYNVDLHGTVRGADGVWDRGAYEFNPNAMPVITSSLSKSGTVNFPITYTITAAGNPSSFSASPLPAGLSINTNTGVISGIPTGAGTTNVTIGATNANGTGTAVLAINISNTASIWSPGNAPVNVSEPDGSAVELGVKFKSDVAGTITGIRFYKGATNTGTHKGNLWTSTGTNLATATFTNETSSGWQQVNFATPVSIAANTTYIASYFAPIGNYSGDLNGLADEIVSPPLRTIANAQSPNGVYLYSATGGFPTQSFSAANYWVDVVFNPAAVPAITSALSKSGVVGVPINYTISATNNPTSYSASPLPNGLSINTTTGVISGTPTSTGTTNVTIGATNANGSDTASLVINIASTASIWTPQDAPVVPSNPDGAVEVGVKFKSDVSGQITAIRFYKGTGNTGTHVGNLWTPSGTNLGTVTFTNETTSGWQQANFATPISITAGTTYVASYHAPNGGYAFDQNGLTTGKDNAPLHAIANSVSVNGVYKYGVTGFPNQSFSATNYWVDVVFQASVPLITSALTRSGIINTPLSYQITATNNPTSFSASPLPAGLTINTSTGLISGTPSSAGTTNVALGATNTNGTGTATLVINIASNVSIWAPQDTPVVSSNPDNAVEVGVKFKSDVSGQITAIRFYKGAGNTGTHVGNLWTSSGTNLGTVTFTNETTSGWQQANFATPISITAGTTYVASYHAPNGGYAFDQNGLTSGKDNAPLHAIANSVSVNGVYKYGVSGFPNQSFSATNYWADVVFVPSSGQNLVLEPLLSDNPQEQILNRQLAVYPNPANSSIRIVTNSNIERNTVLMIYDLTGKLLLTRRIISNTEVVDVSKFKNGLYLLKMKSGHTVNSKTFVVQHK